MNVFEWCWEHSQAEGDDRRVLLHLAFHAENDSYARLLDMPTVANALGMTLSRLCDSLAALCNLGELEERHGHTVYAFAAYENATREAAL